VNAIEILTGMLTDSRLQLEDRESEALRRIVDFITALEVDRIHHGGDGERHTLSGTVDKETLQAFGLQKRSSNATRRVVTALREGIRISIDYKDRVPARAARQIEDHTVDAWVEIESTALPCSFQQAQWLTRGMNELDRDFALDAMAVAIEQGGEAGSR
jgi:hypothetical protein